MTQRFVLIGGGQTSASAARTMRRHGFDGEIVIIGEEPHRPYQRPPLSKEYLQGAADLDEVWVNKAEWYDENRIDLRLGTGALSIDPSTQAVTLSDGSQLTGDAVLIATGGRPRRLPDAEGERILYLRKLEDSDRLRSFLGSGKKLLVVGAGFIGSEVAASARSVGTEVTMIEALQTPLERVLGKDLGQVCASIHIDHGVDLRCGVGVDSIEETATGVVVRTNDGQVLEGDAVVIGIGMQPNDELARASEITVGNGVRVDEFCRTSMEGVFAAGDVANHYHPLFDRRMRVEHFDNATRHGAAAALNMLGQRTAFASPHWFWSDQYEYNLQYVGHAEKWDSVATRGSIPDRDFVVFFLLEGRIEAAFGIDRGGDILAIKSLIADKKVIDPAVLADDDVDLGELLIPASEERSFGEEAASAIEGNYIRMARSGQIPEGIVRRFEHNGLQIAIARSGGQTYALNNFCTHLACHLSSGKVEDGGLVCLCHGSIFDLATGDPINPPATRSVKTYPIKEENGQVYVAFE